MARPYLNVTLGVRSCIFLSFESVKTAKKLWREGNTTAEFFYTNPGLKQRGEPKAYKASSHSTSAPLVPLAREGRGTPPPRSSFA